MRKPVKKFNVKSFIFSFAVLAGVFLTGVVCAYAFGDGIVLDTGDSAEPESSVTDALVEEYLDKGIDIDINAASGMFDQSEETGTKHAYGKIVYKINSKPGFKKPDSAGDLMIENHADNIHLIKVRIDENLDGVTIYESGYIAPNMNIKTAPLDAELEKGSYECTAVISAYDIETQKLIGSFEKQITIAIG